MSIGPSMADGPMVAITPSGPGAPMPAWLRPWLNAARWRRPGAGATALGSLALLAGAACSGLLVPHWQADTRAAGQVLHQRATAARRASPVRAPEPGPAQRLQAALPPADQTPARLAGLLALAQRHDVMVTSARQSPAAAHGGNPGQRIDAVPVAWRIQGRYADLRGFIAAALQADPGLVLEQLRLSRSDGRAVLLDADLQWQLLAQPAR